MTLQFLQTPAAMGGESPCVRHAVAMAVLALASVSGAHAQTDAAASAAATASAAEQAAPLAITVHPGQSLNDIAIAVTQSRDPAVLARAGRALFDANPQAFMKRDPSRLKIGAQLTVPALDATGAALNAHAASGGAAASGVTASGSAHAQSAVAAVTASAGSAGTPSAGEPVGASHAVVTGAAAAHGAYAASSAASARPAVGASGASAAEAVPPHAQPATPGIAAASSSPDTGGPHVWNGSIQPTPAPNGTSAAGADGAVSAVAANPSLAGSAAVGVSQARPSSLQQLLALKNRVLMELQKHGIGKPTGDAKPAVVVNADGARQSAQDTAGPASASASAIASSVAVTPASVSSDASSAPSAVAPAPAAPSRAAVVHQLPFDIGVAAAAGAAALALIVGLALRRRGKKRSSADEAVGPSALEPAAMPAPEAAAAPDVAGSVHGARKADDDSVAARREGGGGTSAAHAASESEAAAARESHDAPPLAAARSVTPEPNEQGGGALAGDADEHSGASPDAAQQPAHAWRPVFPRDAIAALDSLDMPLPPRMSAAADADHAPSSRPADSSLSLARQNATNGQSAAGRPVGATDPHDSQPQRTARQQEAERPGEPQTGESRRHGPALASDGESGAQPSPMARPQAVPDANLPSQPQPVEAPNGGERRESDAGSVAEQSQAAPSAPVAPVDPGALPQRPALQSGAMSAGTTASALPIAPSEPNTESNPAPAPSPAPASLGVAQFGPLNLDFDLELPASPSASLPAFTPEALAKIARNKLELVAEYVELGDLAGARTLLQEVIEANHAGTRDEARAMLAKLDELSR
ncbi:MULTISPECIES: FimV/HubP family polar landmark protein [Burkholderia]|uniref:FimV/HubP family polar landmark protein n=1 Tax=Burkholderia TaxID=32008 RepID=UPI0008412ECF|nr:MULTISPECIES: FimV/HubP family polar landmark protein [unclassified Burkholderia]AOK32549.1 hypothetical protein AQ611_18125 [Burkholderia sp. Bp7605]